MQSLFSKIRNNIVIVDENENIVSEEYSESGRLNNFFKHATKNLQINENPYIIDEL